MKKSVLISVTFSVLITVIACSYTMMKSMPYLHNDVYITDGSESFKTTTGNIKKIVQRLPSESDSDKYYRDLDIFNPYNGSLFPCDMASPTFIWGDGHPLSTMWLISVRFENTDHKMYVLTDRTQWTPDEAAWKTIKANSLNRKASVTITGIDRDNPYEIVTRSGITFSTSRDEVGAPIFYVQMPLPFARAKGHPELFQWRFGTVSSYERPPVVMQNLPACGNCHHFSRDGKKFGMDIDYNKDKGAYILAPVMEEMLLTGDDFITWNDYRGSGYGKSSGFFSRISPDGRYVVSTVKEQSFFAMLSDPDFSQFFFPARGHIAWYDIEKGTFSALPGADDPDYVQTCPAWSPDGGHIVFSRARVDRNLLEVLDGKNYINVGADVRISDLNKKYRIHFDLYRVPFNNGKGGIAEPLAGAAHNGRSNYFPRFSPDGKWIVFTRSPTGLAIQPESKLYIVSAEGGIARKLRCNTNIMNSWHSWSPNSRWLVFSSKTNTPYTELFITHIDENGYDSPPVLLSRFSTEDLACVAPEFVNLEPGAIRTIQVVGK
jgi:Tol biopolymer transport system component